MQQIHILLISILDQVNNYDSPLKWGQLAKILQVSLLEEFNCTNLVNNSCVSITYLLRTIRLVSMETQSMPGSSQGKLTSHLSAGAFSTTVGET